MSYLEEEGNEEGNEEEDEEDGEEEGPLVDFNYETEEELHRTIFRRRELGHRLERNASGTFVPIGLPSMGDMVYGRKDIRIAA
ncbi:hypothetical protein FPQ18DRAFT_390385 [Pyronema domesticum]|nr:hypothetical protein FPQ18DRAFT_390385 [Pyronema domesticum]